MKHVPQGASPVNDRSSASRRPTAATVGMPVSDVETVLPVHTLSAIDVLPQATTPLTPGLVGDGVSLQLVSSKKGKAGRQKQRSSALATVKRARIMRGLTETGYLIGRDGRARRPQSGRATANLFNHARAIRDEAIDFPIGFDTLPRRAASVMSLSASFVADRSETTQVRLSDNSGLGEISSANAPWFRMPQDAYSHPGEPSAFAAPLTHNGEKAASTYNKDKGVFSQATFRSTEELAHGQRTLVSSAESARGAGAGLAQVLADDVRGNRSVTNRNAMYGHDDGLGYLPGGYSGSQADIAMVDDDAHDHDYSGILNNPMGLQTEIVLADERRRRTDGLRRSHSNPDLTATPNDHDADTFGLLDTLGLQGRHVTRRRSIG